MRRLASGLIAAIATLLLAVALSWPLASGLARQDRWISGNSDGSEVYGTTVMHQRIEACLQTALAEPGKGEGRLTSLLLAPTRCAFRTGSWNVVDVVAFTRPLKAILGPVAHWNGLFMMVIWLNCWSGWLLGRRFGGHWAGGVAGAFILGFSPLVISQAYQGRPIVAMLFAFAPVLVGLDRILRGEGGAATAILTGLAMGLLVNIYWYNAHFLALALPGLAPALFVAGKRWPRALALAGVALVAFLLVLPSLGQFREMTVNPAGFPVVPRIEESASVPRPGSAELRPDQATLLIDSLPVDGLLAPKATWLPVTRDNLGWIPTGLLILGAVGLLRWRASLGWLVTFALSLVLSWGPWLHPASVDALRNVDGVSNPLYAAFYALVPLARGLRHPDRFVTPMLLALAALAATGAAVLAAGELPYQRGRWRWLTAPLALALVLTAAWEERRGGLLPIRLTSMPAPAGLLELASQSREVLHLPTAHPRPQGARLTASLRLENRILGMSVFHGGCVVRSLSPAPRLLARHAAPPEWRAVAATLDLDDPQAVLQAGGSLPAGLRAGGIQAVIADEGGYITLHGTEPGRRIYAAMRDALTASLGAPSWQGAVQNGWVFTASAEGEPVPDRIDMAVYAVR